MFLFTTIGAFVDPLSFNHFFENNFGVWSVGESSGYEKMTKRVDGNLKNKQEAVYFLADNFYFDDNILLPLSNICNRMYILRPAHILVFSNQNVWISTLTWWPHHHRTQMTIQNFGTARKLWSIFFFKIHDSKVVNLFTISPQICHSSLWIISKLGKHLII